MRADRQEFYIAGPFFNAPQLELIQRIELAFATAHVPFFSPRLQDQNSIGSKLTDEDALRIKDSNRHHMYGCRSMVAVVDWLLPENQQVRLCQSAGDIVDPISKVPPLSIPDSGTIWEMGFFEGIGKAQELYLFTTKAKKLNIMLTQAIGGVIHGLDELKKFLNSGLIDRSILKQWEGGHQ